MVIKSYTVKNPTKDIVDYFTNLSNRIDLNLKGGELSASINHIDSTAETNFETDLGKRLGILVDDIPTNLGKYLEEIKTDAFVYATEKEITLNNIGVTYKDLFTDYMGRPFFMDTRGYKSLAAQILWTKNGTGTQRLRIVDNATDTQLIESGSLTTQSNDFANVALPNEALNFVGKWRLQVKSTVGTDSPIFSGIRIYLRR